MKKKSASERIEELKAQIAELERKIEKRKALLRVDLVEEYIERTGVVRGSLVAGHRGMTLCVMRVIDHVVDGRGDVALRCKVLGKDLKETAIEPVTIWNTLTDAPLTEESAVNLLNVSKRTKAVPGSRRPWKPSRKKI